MVPIIIYTDGACKRNPGRMGIGLVIIYNSDDPINGVQRIGKYIGYGTNNIAELNAIKLALNILHDLRVKRPAIIYTDSQYCINILTRFKPKVNVELVNEIKHLLWSYTPGVILKHILGHSGHHFNEMADRLASDAAKK